MLFLNFKIIELIFLVDFPIAFGIKFKLGMAESFIQFIFLSLNP